MEQQMPQEQEMSTQRQAGAQPEIKTETMNRKYYRDIPEKEKAKAVLMILTKRKKQKEIMAEMGVTKEAVRQWKNKAILQMAQAFMGQGRKRGRKPKNYVPDENLRESYLKAKEKEQILLKRVEELEAEKRKAKQDLQIARQAMGFFNKKEDDDVKKNEGIQRIAKGVFSQVPKKRLRLE